MICNNIRDVLFFHINCSNLKIPMLIGAIIGAVLSIWFHIHSSKQRGNGK